MTMFRTLAAVLLATALLAQEPIIRTKVTQVLVPVNVTDSDGNFIEGLEAQNFILRDDGVAVKQFQVDTSQTTESPVDVVVAIDTSGISQPVLQKLHNVGGMIQPIVAGEKGSVAVLAYDDEVRVLQDFTRDSDDIRQVFQHLQGRRDKSAMLLDGVSKAVELLRRRPGDHRRVLVIIGESRDRGSKAKLKDVIAEIQRASVAVYPVTYSTQKTAWTARPGDDASADSTDYAGGFTELGRFLKSNVADAFSRASGGRHLSFARLEGLQEALGQVGVELRTQYLLSFVPPDSSNKGFHPLLVSVTGNGSGKAVIRARPGYWP